MLGATLVFEDAPKNAAKGFGPLEALLEDIFSAYVNRRVHPLLSTSGVGLANLPAGICGHQKQD